METFGDRVYKLRKKIGLSQLELAKKIGSSKGTIQNYEANTLPKGEFAIKLAEVFGCTIDWLLTGKEVGPLPENKPPKDPEKDPPEKSKVTRVIIEHQKLLTLFKDPERAKEINENLIEIEQLSDELMESIAQHIKSSLTAAKIIQGSSKKKSGESDQDNYQDGKSA